MKLWNSELESLKELMILKFIICPIVTVNIKIIHNKTVGSRGGKIFLIKYKY